MIKLPRIRIMIVDDHDMLREGLAAFLRAFPDLELVGEASNGVEAVRLCHQIQPDVILMDLMMPEMDGVSAIKAIHDSHPGIGIIALTSYGDEKTVKAALQAGAKSYLLKNISASHLAEAIRATCSGLPTLAPEVTQVLISTVELQEQGPGSMEALTAREKQVHQLLRKGYSNDQIALELSISRNTVKNHVSNILSKLNLKTRTEIILSSIEPGSS